MSVKHKIICTLGPASKTKHVICAMAKAGMRVGRLNFSHANHRAHQQIIDLIHQVNRRLKIRIKILQDLGGYRIRIGILAKPLTLKPGEKIWITGANASRKNSIPLDTDVNFAAFKKDMDIYISDGLIGLKVEERYPRRIKARVINGGVIRSRKGVNIPGLKLKTNILTAKDKTDITFGIKNKVDFIAQSFVRNRQDIRRVCDRVYPFLPKCRVIAKIENSDGVRNIDHIIDACDGVMVARGDLGVSLPIHKIPLIQKDIIRRCNQKKKIVITATQMLESMTNSPRPTRAEVSDVANAILDGSDYVMLSGETAAGNYPVESVKMMAQIVSAVQSRMN